MTRHIQSGIGGKIVGDRLKSDFWSVSLAWFALCGEGGIGYCADHVGLLRLTPFPTARRRGPCKPNCAKSGKPCLLFPIPLSTSKLVPRYKKQKVSNFSIPFCFVILRRGRDWLLRRPCRSASLNAFPYCSLQGPLQRVTSQEVDKSTILFLMPTSISRLMP